VKYGKEMIQTSREWPNPFGEGKAAQKIVETMLPYIEK
jgi:UDP-N-acetylglucosamine 2-epimerase